MNTVLTENHGSTALLTLNRPDRLNALNAELIDDLWVALDNALRSPSVRAIILTGSGERAFCAGDDLKDAGVMPDSAVRPMIEKLQDISRLILFSETPVIAAVNGWAAGGGFEWVLNCDISIWSETARAFFPETALGIGVTGGVTALLPMVLGLHRAKSMILMGEKYTAAQLLALGLADEVVPASRLIERAHLVADQIASQPRMGVRTQKAAFNMLHRDYIEKALNIETELVSSQLIDPDVKKTIADFSSR